MLESKGQAVYKERKPQGCLGTSKITLIIAVSSLLRYSPSSSSTMQDSSPKERCRHENSKTAGCLCLVLVQPRETCPYITERLLMGRKESNKNKNIQAESYLPNVLPLPKATKASLQPPRRGQCNTAHLGQQTGQLWNHYKPVMANCQYTPRRAMVP